MSGSQSPNRADEAMSESSQNRQSEPMREATPRPEQATHMVIENFMIKMTELLETSMDTRRNERVPATRADEALERFLKFRPLEFYGDVEQEIKVELFLEQLNDICDTLKYEDAQRVTIGSLELPKLGYSRTNHGPGMIFKKNSKRNTYLVGFVSNERMDTNENKTRQFVKGLRVELQWALAPLPPMGFAVVVEAAMRTEMADQARLHINVLDKDHGNLEIKRSRGEQRTRNEGRPTLTPGGAHRVCTYCGRSGHVDEMCYRKLRLCFKCGKPRDTKDQCPEMQQVPLETFRKAGRPPVYERSNRRKE
ncbi:hypothetical protein M9H77_28600 [Catharanthus roseus]|uniref:Uncharacterized protein n=1 Tax=Catharanthus roseus TaxID=4058 RepID=A0ACC0AIG0_CATRO|nr:hypothetical protein M9H77_28600 [Catharanthus roseus]